MGIAENIKRLRLGADLTQEQLAGMLNVTRPTVTQWESGWSQPRMGMVEKLAKIFDVSLSAIVDEPTSIRDLPKGAIIPKASAEAAFAPLRGSVHAGDMTDEEAIEGMIELPKSVLDGHPNSFFLRVEGDCMDRVYPEGCFVLIDRSRCPKNGSIAAFENENYQAVMRRYFKGANTVILSPDSNNADHEDIVLDSSLEQTISLIGTVVWFQASKELE